MRIRVTWKDCSECKVGIIEGFDDFEFRIHCKTFWYPQVCYSKGELDDFSDMSWGIPIEEPERLFSNIENAQDWCVNTFLKMLERWKSAMEGNDCFLPRYDRRTENQ